MELTKKQIKALLDVMSNDATRPVLCTVYVDTYKERTVLVATDGYVLATIDAPDMMEHLGKFIQRADLIKWYKLATGKQTFTKLDADEIMREDVGNYPGWIALLDELDPANGESHFYLNAKYLMTMQGLNDGIPLRFQTHGGTRAYIAESNGNTYAIMPLKG